MATYNSHAGVFFFLAFMLVVTICGSIGFFIFGEDGPSRAEQQKPSSIYLENDGKSGTSPLVQEEKKPIPKWLFLLVGAFLVLQIWPVMLAASKADYRPLTLSDLREINFLCETPMYLGLLGSLFGICITQFTTGSTAAPLAYLTTITGILLFLFAKFTIWLSLPHGGDFDDA